MVNTDLMAEPDRPRLIGELAEPKWRGRTGIAKPLFGTTATHAACLFAAWGEDRAKEYFRRLRENRVKILSGNKQVALSVAAGQLAFGLTDTDDAIEEVENGRPVAIVYPDQGEGQIGTLVIPNTLAIIKGSPNPEAARRLVRLPALAGRGGEAGPGTQRSDTASSVARAPRAPGTPRSFQENGDRFQCCRREMGCRGEIPPRRVCARRLTDPLLATVGVPALAG